jgi:hypothetical protein
VLEIFSANPWLVAVAEIALVSLVGTVCGIVCISVCVCTRKVRLARYDFELKRDMLERGLSAEEIRTVIEAGRVAAPAAEACRADWSGRSADGVRSVPLAEEMASG